MAKRNSFLINLYFRFSYLPQILWSALVFIFLALVIIIAAGDDNVKTNPIGWNRSVILTNYGIKAENLKVASKGNYIAVAFESSRDNNASIYVCVSFNGGVSFLKPVKVADISSKTAINPDVAVSGSGIVTVVWHSLVETEVTNRIFLSSSSDMGANWSTPVPLNFGNEIEMLPRIFYDNRERLHLFFHGYKKEYFNLYHTVKNMPQGFRKARSLMKVDKNMKGAFFPAIANKGKYIFFVWQGKRANFSDDLYFIKSSDYGESWSRSVPITSSKFNDASPQIIFYRNTVYCVYRNNDSGNWRIKLIRGYDAGERWDSKAVSITETDVDCFSPTLARVNGDIIVSWYDLRDKTSSIYSRKFNLNEMSLSEKDVKLSERRFNSRNPFSVSSGKRIAVFWQEKGRLIVKLTDVHVDPPDVYSDTHPEGTWKRRAVAQVKWKKPDDESGIAGYAVMVTKPSDSRHIRDINPTIQNVQAGINRRVIPDLEDGVNYFHIRAIDGAGNWSRTVHYRIQVSSTPLPMPVLVSPTHPDPGKPGRAGEAQFRWAIDGRERLKGFVYSFSRNSASKPERFTKDFSINFKNLIDGNYFFNIAAVDKTNMTGKTADYYVIVGKAEHIDPDELMRLARIDEKKKIRKKLPPLPFVKIILPFGADGILKKDSFNAGIVVENLPKENIDGYSIAIDRKEITPVQRVNYRRSDISVKDLKNGDYYLSVISRYYTQQRGIKKYHWTPPAVAKIRVSIPVERSPVMHYASQLMEKFKDRSAVTLLLLFFVLLPLVVMTYGTKLIFYSRLAAHRFRLFLRAIFPLQ